MFFEQLPVRAWVAALRASQLKTVERTYSFFHFPSVVSHGVSPLFLSLLSLLLASGAVGWAGIPHVRQSDLQLVLTEVSDSCCAQYHHISWLLWVENSEEIQDQVMSSSLPLPQSMFCSLFFLSQPFFVAQLVIVLFCQSSIAILTTSAPGDICLSWCGSL